jgi:hypothetical protein
MMKKNVFILDCFLEEKGVFKNCSCYQCWSFVLRSLHFFFIMIYINKKEANKKKEFG